MRPLLALAAALALSTPAAAQDGEATYVWPVPSISRDISTLPEPVQAKRQALIDAARSGDIGALGPIMEAQQAPPNVSFGAPDDALAHLREVSEDGEGRQILGLLLDLFDQPYAFHPDSGGPTYYIWPYLAEIDPNAMTPEQIVDAYRLLDSAQIEAHRQAGAWHYWRIVISESGEWTAFVAGD